MSRRGKVVVIDGKKYMVKVGKTSTRSKTTHLSEKSTSRLSQNLQDLNKKLLQSISN